MCSLKSLLGFSMGPASSKVTLTPKSVRTLVTVPPPAPEPITTTSCTCGLRRIWPDFKLDSVLIPAAWEFAPQAGSIDNAAGTLEDAAFTTFNSPKAGSFLAATLNFTMLAGGSSVVQLTPSATFVFSDINAFTPAVKFGSGTVMSAVPEPSTFALLTAGLGLAAVMRRKQQG